MTDNRFKNRKLGSQEEEKTAESQSAVATANELTGTSLGVCDEFTAEVSNKQLLEAAGPSTSFGIGSATYVTYSTSHHYHPAAIHTESTVDPSVSCEKFSTKDIDILRSNLKQAYCNKTLPTASWMQTGRKKLHFDDYYVQLQLRKGTHSSLAVDVTLQMLIEGQKENPSPKRILVESQPGYGKTTLSWKIAHNWARTVNEPLLTEVDYMIRRF